MSSITPAFNGDVGDLQSFRKPSSSPPSSSSSDRINYNLTTPSHYRDGGVRANNSNSNTSGGKGVYFIDFETLEAHYNHEVHKRDRLIANLRGRAEALAKEKDQCMLEHKSKEQNMLQLISLMKVDLEALILFPRHEFDTMMHLEYRELERLSQYSSENKDEDIVYGYGYGSSSDIRFSPSASSSSSFSSSSSSTSPVKSFQHHVEVAMTIAGHGDVGKMESLRRLLKSKGDLASSLQLQVRTQQKELAALADRASAREASLGKEREAWLGQRKAAALELQDASHRWQGAEAELSAAKLRLLEREDDLARTKQQLCVEEKARAAADMAMCELEGRLQAATADAALATSHVSEARAQTKGMQEELQRCLLETSRLRSQIGASEDRLGVLRLERDGLLGDSQSQAESMAAQSNALEQARREQQRLAKERDALQLELDAAKAARVEMEEQALELDTTRAALGQKTTSLAAAEAALLSVRMQLENSKQSHDRAMESNRRLGTEAAAAEALRAAEMVAAKAALESELKTICYEMSVAEQRWQAELDGLRDELSYTRTAVNAKDSEMQSLSQELNELQARLGLAEEERRIELVEEDEITHCPDTVERLGSFSNFLYLLYGRLSYGGGHTSCFPPMHALRYTYYMRCLYKLSISYTNICYYY